MALQRNSVTALWMSYLSVSVPEHLQVSFKLNLNFCNFLFYNTCFWYNWNSTVMVLVQIIFIWCYCWKTPFNVGLRTYVHGNNVLKLFWTWIYIISIWELDLFNWFMFLLIVYFGFPPHNQTLSCWGQSISSFVPWPFRKGSKGLSFTNKWNK